MRTQPKHVGYNRAPGQGQRLPKKGSDHCRWLVGLPQIPNRYTAHIRAGRGRRPGSASALSSGHKEPRLASDSETGKRNAELLRHSAGRAMIGGSDKCVRGLSGLAVAFSAVAGTDGDSSPVAFLR